MTTDYNHISHSHCWNQEQPSACGIPLEKHSQCCLCDLTMTTEKKCCEICAEIKFIRGENRWACSNKNCPCHQSKCCELCFHPSNGGIQTYCKNRNCPYCHQSQGDDWEKRFDKFALTEIGLGSTSKKVREFIRQEREKARMEGRKEAEREPSILHVGFHKGEMDFGVNGSIRDLTYEQMRDFREMVVVGIGQAEDMWRSLRQEKVNIAAQDTPTPLT